MKKARKKVRRITLRSPKVFSPDHAIVKDFGRKRLRVTLRSSHTVTHVIIRRSKAKRLRDFLDVWLKQTGDLE